MANKINDMGNEVVEGFACKPKNFDPSRPIMHYKSMIFICDDERCQKAHKTSKAQELRELLKELGLNKGKDRIKVTRVLCFGACRFRGVAHITQNTQSNGELRNNSLWLRKTHLYSAQKWLEIFKSLQNSIPLEDVLDKDDFIPMKVYE
jgi:cobalt-precorrin 5A hydrolase